MALRVQPIQQYAACRQLQPMVRVGLALIYRGRQTLWPRRVHWLFSYCRPHIAGRLTLYTATDYQRRISNHFMPHQPTHMQTYDLAVTVVSETTSRQHCKAFYHTLTTLLIKFTIQILLRKPSSHASRDSYSKTPKCGPC